MSATRSTNTTMSAVLLSLFERIWSYTTLELHLHRLFGVLFDLEVLPRSVAEHAGNDVGRERLLRRVVRHHGVVVELPRVGDLSLGSGELLLQHHEVLVRLEVRVALG